MIDSRGRARPRQLAGHGCNDPQLREQTLRALRDAVREDGLRAQVGEPRLVQRTRVAPIQLAHAHGEPGKLRHARDVAAPPLKGPHRPVAEAELLDLRPQHGPHRADLAAVVHLAEQRPSLLAEAPSPRAIRVMAPRAFRTVWATAASLDVLAQRPAELRVADAADAWGVQSAHSIALAGDLRAEGGAGPGWQRVLVFLEASAASARGGAAVLLACTIESIVVIQLLAADLHVGPRGPPARKRHRHVEGQGPHAATRGKSRS